MSYFEITQGQLQTAAALAVANITAMNAICVASVFKASIIIAVPPILGSIAGVPRTYSALFAVGRFLVQTTRRRGRRISARHPLGTAD